MESGGSGAGVFVLRPALNNARESRFYVKSKNAADFLK